MNAVSRDEESKVGMICERGAVLSQKMDSERVTESTESGIAQVQALARILRSVLL